MRHHPFATIATRLALPALLLLALPTAIAAQDLASLQGVVGDDGTMRPIEGATITLVGLDRATRTDENGRFAFSDPPLGRVSVRVDIPGYVTMTEEVDVTSERIQFVQFFVPNLSAMLQEMRVSGRPDRERMTQSPQDATALDLLARQTLGVRRGSGTVGETNFSILPRGARSFTQVGELMVYLDGARVGGTRRAVDILAEIPAEDVEDIRVLRGPASAFLAGSFASEGVIHVTTKTGGRR